MVTLNVNSLSLKANNVHVSVGVREIGGANVQANENYFLGGSTTDIDGKKNSGGIDDGANTTMTMTLNSSVFSTTAEFNLRDISTSLSTDELFLQLPGKTKVEIDSSGIFISSSSSSVTSSTPGTGGKVDGDSDGDMGRSGIFIASSFLQTCASDLLPAVEVHCVQPASLVLTLPVLRKPAPESTPKSPVGVEDDLLAQSQSPSITTTDGVESGQVVISEKNGMLLLYLPYFISSLYLLFHHDLFILPSFTYP